MPGFDGTGPMGMGPRTGGGRGFCSPLPGPLPYGGFYPYGSYPYGSYFYGGYPYGFGVGYGVGRSGFPRGCGRGHAFGGRRFRWW